MRTLNLFVMVVLMTVLTASQTLPAPQAITDPKQITSKPDARVEKNLSIEKLYICLLYTSRIPGRNEQMPRTSSSISTPACEAR